MDKLVLCAIAKCENKYIKEWVDWHFGLGFDRIVIYDNNDAGGERVSDVLGKMDNIEIIDWSSKKQRCCEAQVSAYNDCYKRYFKWNWIMFLDVDEFLEFRGGISVKEYMNQNWVRKANCIKFHWKCYSDSGHIKAVDGLVTENYTDVCKNQDVNKYIKSFFRCGMQNFAMLNVHYSTQLDNIYYNNGRLAPYMNQTMDNTINYDSGWVRHYVTKSMEEYVSVKYARRGSGSSKTRLNPDFYFKYNEKTPEKWRMLNEMFASFNKFGRLEYRYAEPVEQNNTETTENERETGKPENKQRDMQPYYANKHIPGRVKRVVFNGNRQSDKNTNPLPDPYDFGIVKENIAKYSAYPYKSYGKQYNGEKCVITLTSWKARIWNVADTIKSVLNVCDGFHIVLVLSSDEFPNMELDMPDNLMELADGMKFEILWVKENIRAFKKVLFTMDRYRDVPVISMDDDMVAKSDYFTEMYNAWDKKRKSFITGHHHNFSGVHFPVSSDIKHTDGCCTLYPPYSFRDYGLMCLDDGIVSIPDSDGYYSALKYYMNLKECESIPGIYNKKFSFTKSENGPESLKKEYETVDRARRRKRMFDLVERNVTSNILYRNLTVLTANFNESRLTECMIKSIRKQLGFPVHVTIIDNSTETPWDFRITENVDVIDNTKYKHTGDWNGSGSVNHSRSIDYALKNIGYEWVLLCDCDVLFKPSVKKLMKFTHKDFDICGEIGHDVNPVDRIFPYMCIINNRKLKELGISYHDDSVNIHMLYEYDTGYTLLENSKSAKLDIREIKINDYALHLKGAVLRKKDYTGWLEDNRVLWDPDYKSMQYPEGVSVCISAWRTADYIEECLDSVANQTWFKNHNNWEILLGIDGCEETLAKVKSIMHKYRNLKVMMMDSNVGTYVTCNTIMKEARYEWLLRFDSDDVMPSDMVANVFSKNLDGVGAIRYEFRNFGELSGRGDAWGSHMVKHAVFDEFGGYRNWRIAADYDFLYRIEENVKIMIMHDVYYERRVRPDSLQFSKNTNMQSNERKKLHEFIKTKTRNDKKIECFVCEFEYLLKKESIAFIIPNRGGVHLNDVIKNINTVYGDYDLEIIVINQCDDKLFKRGQLCNIGLLNTNCEYVAISDNDIFHFKKIDLIKEYENNGNKPYLGFTYITQIKLNGNSYKKGESKINTVGAGGFLFGRLSDFIICNGFSNLYSGWGCEDNEISCRICNDNSHKPMLKHINNELGHITHPSRIDRNIFETNRKIFFSRMDRDVSLDGLHQIRYNIVSVKKIKNVTYMDVNNIGVCDSFKYKNMIKV